MRKAVDLEIVLLHYVLHINENIFSSSFVKDCSGHQCKVKMNVSEKKERRKQRDYFMVGVCERFLFTYKQTNHEVICVFYKY